MEAPHASRLIGNTPLEVQQKLMRQADIRTTIGYGGRSNGEQAHRQQQRGSGDSPPEIGAIIPENRKGAFSGRPFVWLDFRVEVRKWLRGPTAYRSCPI